MRFDTIKNSRDDPVFSGNSDCAPTKDAQGTYEETP
jgi:hypothetical protein